MRQMVEDFRCAGPKGRGADAVGVLKSPAGRVLGVSSALVGAGWLQWQGRVHSIRGQRLRRQRGKEAVEQASLARWAPWSLAVFR